MIGWGSFFSPKDSLGRESRTLAFVGLSFIAVGTRFIFGGLDFALGPFHFAVPVTTVTEFGGAITLILSPWLGREWIKVQEGKTPC